MRGKITIKSIDKLRTAAQSASKDQFLWCDSYRNFGVKATPRGSISFVVQKYQDNRTKRITIGPHPWLTIKDARARASLVISNIYLQRLDNITFERLPRTNAMNGDPAETLNSAFEKYNKRKQNETVRRAFHRDIIPYFGPNKLIHTFTKAEISAFIDKKADTTPEMALKLFKFLRAFFNDCVDKDIITKSPMYKKHGIKSKSRNRKLSKQEIYTFWNVSDQLGYPYGHFYKLALLTGQRNREEIALMRWCEINFEERIWTIPSERSKNDLEHIVYLNDLALKVLGEIANLNLNSEFVFVNGTNQPIVAFSFAKDKFNKLANIPNFTIHDLRKTITSHLAQLGVLNEVAQRILNHVSDAQQGVNGVYNLYDYERERNEALALWGRFIEDILN